MERLEEHARSLAEAQPVEPRLTKGHALSVRLAGNGAVLLSAYRAIAAAVAEGGAITPSAEWLIDNYHLVEKQIREIRSDLPPGYYRQLPKLADGPFVGYPRVFGVAWALVAHTDSRFDPEMLSRYLKAYQEIQPLTIGELWAISITFRIMLIENLRRLAQAIVDDRIARRDADALADRLLGVGGGPSQPVATVLAKHEQDGLPDAFAVQLVHRQRDQDPRITPALVWLDQRLAARHTTADTVVRDVHRSQGAANVTIRNIITSLRLISDLDWQEMFGLIATFPIYEQIARVANPALAAAQAATPVSIAADPATCSFMFNPLGNRKFTSPCDVARQTLSAASANYTRVDPGSSAITQVRIGDRVFMADPGAGFDAPAFAAQLKDALKQAGFGVPAAPDRQDQVKIVALLLVLLLAMALGYAPVGVAMAEMFPARIRYTAMSFPYHLSSGWIGGLLPTFSFAIAVAQGNIFAGLWYTVGWLIVGLAITGLFYREPGVDPE